MCETFYDFKNAAANGEMKPLSDYAGKVVLIVNTASKCGFTPQYEGLEAVWRDYKDRGLVILGFPCNQFAGQEPGDASEISNFCTLNYDVTFPLMAKIDVNGAKADPLWKWLKKSKSGLLGSSIKWNFTKFLVDRDGKVVERFAPNYTPKQLRRDIERLL
jgi:glutathione peroxidase